MTPILEKMARELEDALHATGNADIQAGLPFVDLAPVARAVLMALREPDEGMLKAAGKIEDFSAVHNFGAPATADDIFTAMIDHILNGETK